MTTDTAESQAKTQLDSIIAMMERQEHPQECAGNEDCTFQAIEKAVEMFRDKSDIHYTSIAALLRKIMEA